jgi:hypothetical protein
LLLIEVLGQSVEICLVDVAGIAGEQISEPEDSLFFRVEQVCVTAPAWLLQRRDLSVGDALPLTRSGVGAGSICAAVDD